MLLSDRDIRDRLPDFGFATDNPSFAFDPDRQIQPCSVDLRVSPIIWVPKKFRRIDLADNTPLGPKVTGAFKQRKMSDDGYLLRPGHFILASTYERFNVPSDLCGRLVGRSSLGRLGLSAAGTANFINPGWSGRMPLVLVNHSPFPIRIHSYLGLAQVCFIRLSSNPTKTYGHDDLGSKYIDDDGGPSRYWKDYTVETLRHNLQLKNASEAAEHCLEVFAKSLDEPTCRRFVKRVNTGGFIADGQDFIGGFIRQEVRRVAATWAIGIAAALITSVALRFSASLSQMGWHGQAALATLATIAISGYGLVYARYCNTSMSIGDLRNAARLSKNV
jgi:deoxycytidine triphosphate deaminase